MTAALALLVIIVDLLTKALAFAIATNSTRGPIQPVLNSGFSTGLFGTTWFVTIALAGCGIGLTAWWTLRLAQNGTLAFWVPGLLIGGALANLLDRVATGAVHDFLAVPFLTVNIADLAVMAGLVGYGIDRRNARRRPSTTERR